MPGVKYTVDVEVNGNGKLDQASRSFEKTSQNVQKIQQRLKGMQNDLYAMAEGGDKSSKAFMDMAKRAGDLKNAMGDTRAIVNYFSDGERAVNGMNSAISATTSTIQGMYGTYSLLGGEANDKLLKNMVALESMNARLSNAYNLLKPDGKAMLYMNEMAKKGNVFAGAMGKAGGFVFKMIPAFKALSIASFVGEMTGLNDKIKDIVSNTDTFKTMLSKISGMKFDLFGTDSTVNWNTPSNVTEGQKNIFFKNLLKPGMDPYQAMANLPVDAQKALQESNKEFFEEWDKHIKEMEYAEDKFAEWKKENWGSKDYFMRKQFPELYSADNVLRLRTERYARQSLTTGKKPERGKTDSLKTTKAGQEKLTSNAPQTFNIYVNKLTEMNGTVVGSGEDLDKLAKNMAEVLRRMLVQLAAEQAQN